MKEILNSVSVCILPLIILIILISAFIKKVPAYEAFIEGAKEGFWISVKIIPYLVAIMAAVSMFRASGAIEQLSLLFKDILEFYKIPADTLPLILTRSLSGGATLGVFSDIVNANGADSYAAKLAAVITGSSETTFYVLSVYFGAIGIKKFRHAVLTGILADIAGIIAAIIICRWWFL